MSEKQLSRETEIKEAAIRAYPPQQMMRLVVEAREDWADGARWADANPPSSSSGEEKAVTKTDENCDTTPGPWFPINYAGFWIIQSGKYYGDVDVLDAEKVGAETAEANAKLVASAPELRAELTHLQSQQAEGMRWIPISEGLPPLDPGDDASIYVLVTAGQFTKHSKQLIFEKSYYNFYSERWQFAITNPTHWMRIIAPSAPTPDKNREL
jgi:hypothetical protein